MNLEKITKYLIYVFLMILPWQTIWIVQEKYFNGSKLEYGTKGFYGTELLLWLIIILYYFIYLRQTKKSIKEGKIKWQWSSDRLFLLSVFCFIAYCFLTIIWSLDREIALQTGTRLLSASLFFLILISGFLNSKKIIFSFLLGSIVPSILGIWQFLSQSTFANKWLGLSIHPAWQAGAAVVSGDSIGRWLRSYGSFTHPNAFGGYLAFCLLAGLVILPLLKNNKLKLTVLSILLLNITALFFTFSRSAWTAVVIWFIIHNKINFSLKENKSNLLGLISLVLMPVILAVIYFPIIKNRTIIDSFHEKQSIEQRIDENKEAEIIIQNNFWFGVGVGNYTSSLIDMWPKRKGYLYQPVHNVFLLLFAELGMAGLSLLLLAIVFFIRFIYSFTFNKIKKTQLQFFGLTFGFAPLVLFDHYLVTSYAGLILIVFFFFLLIPPQQMHNTCE